MPETEDLYEILQVSPSAEAEVIRAAYRRLAFMYHPDRNPSSDSTRIMSQINAAYEILGDPVKRAEYDRSRAAQATSSGSRAGYTQSSASQPRGGQGNWRHFGNSYNNIGIHIPDSTHAHSLAVRFIDGQLQLYVAMGVKIPPPIPYSERTNVNWKYDNGPTRDALWYVNPNRNAVAMPVEYIIESIQALGEAREFTITVHRFGEPPITASFLVGGFREAIGPIYYSWRRAGSPDPDNVARSGGGCLLPVAAFGAIVTVVPAIWYFL